jgi:hypothetical protein
VTELHTTTIGGGPITIRKRFDRRLVVNGQRIVAISTLAVGVALLYGGGGVIVTPAVYEQALGLLPSDEPTAAPAPEQPDAV